MGAVDLAGGNTPISQWGMATKSRARRTSRSASSRRWWVSRANLAPAALEPLSAQIWRRSHRPINRHSAASKRVSQRLRETTIWCSSPSPRVSTSSATRSSSSASSRASSPPTMPPSYRTYVPNATSTQEKVWLIHGGTSRGAATIGRAASHHRFHTSTTGRRCGRPTGATRRPHRPAHRPPRESAGCRR